MAEKDTTSFVEKILDKSISNILTTLTAIIVGGCGFLLFQFSTEYDSIQQQKFELQHKFDNAKYTLDMGAIFMNGWYVTESSDKSDYVLKQFLIHMNSDDVEIDAETFRWIEESIITISEERARISGYVIDKESNNGLDYEIQQGLLKIEDTRLAELKLMRDMAVNWHNLSPTERQTQFVELTDRMTEYSNAQSEIIPKTIQGKEIALVEVERRSILWNELDLREKSLERKKLWSISGIIIFGTIFLGLIFLKTNKKQIRKQTSSQHRQRKSKRK